MQRPDGSLYLAERHGQPIEAVHVHQGDSNDCGPHVVTMAINFWHGEQRLDAETIAKTMNRPRVQRSLIPVVVRRVPNWATMPWGIVDVLQENGIPARWQMRATEEDIQRALREDRLLMPIYGEPFRRDGWRWKGWSHVALLVGEDADVYWFVDSVRHNAPTSRPRAEFLRLWGNTGRLLIETT
ncbi:MAG: hypothetical protein JXQ72_14180 [Anaerolineae bacterium]|nr:hypothetical protein [Anaerolineae bacterium]